MAQPHLWLPTELVRQSLSLAEVPEDEAHVERCRDSAVRLAERITRRPLTGAVARFVLPRNGNGPVQVPPLRDVDPAQGTDGLVSLGYWGYHEARAGAAAVLIEDEDGNPDVAAFERVAEHGEGWDAPTAYRIWPADGSWPAQAGLFEVRLGTGVNPALNEDIRQGCLMLCRIYYQGMAALTADERRGLQLVLPGVSTWLGSDLQ